MRYVSLGDVPAKRHAQPRRNGTLAGRGGPRLRGLLAATSRSSTTCTRPAGCRRSASSTPIVREEWVPDAHVHRLTDTAPLEPGGDPVERPARC